MAELSEVEIAMEIQKLKSEFGSPPQQVETEEQYLHWLLSMTQQRYHREIGSVRDRLKQIEKSKSSVPNVLQTKEFDPEILQKLASNSEESNKK